MTSNYENDPEQPQNFYQVIGVSKEATVSEIRKAYYKLSRKYHPDKNGGCPEATKKFQTLAEAYETLSDDEKRAEYDSALLVEAADKEQQDRWGQQQGQAGVYSYGATEEAYQSWYAYQQQQQAAAELERRMMMHYFEQQAQAAILREYLAAELQRQAQEAELAELLRQEQERQRAQEEEKALLQELERLKQQELERQERAAKQKAEQDRIRHLRQREEANRAAFFEPSFVPRSRKPSKVATEKMSAAPPKTKTSGNCRIKEPGRRVLGSLGNQNSHANKQQKPAFNAKSGSATSKKSTVNSHNVPSSIFTHRKNGTEQAVFCVKKDGTPCAIGRRMGCVCSKHKSQTIKTNTSTVRSNKNDFRVSMR